MLLSTQAVQEFYVGGSRKLGMPRRELREAVAALLDLPLVPVGAAEIVSALHTEERYQISFWDALILAAAESGGAGVLYTEDLNDGQQYRNGAGAQSVPGKLNHFSPYQSCSTLAAGIGPSTRTPGPPHTPSPAGPGLMRGRCRG